MGSQTEIAWTDATWSPVVGCTAASPGCSNCYAREMHERRHKAYRAGAKMPAQYAKPFSMVQIFEDRLQIPSRWKKPRRIFVCSMKENCWKRRKNSGRSCSISGFNRPPANWRMSCGSLR